MFPLARGVAILKSHTRLTYLETNASPLDIAAFGAAGVHLVHLTGCQRQIDEINEQV
jgi:hypothetical protein